MKITFEVETVWDDKAKEYISEVFAYVGAPGSEGYSQPVVIHRETYERYNGSTRIDLCTYTAETFLRKLGKVLAIVEDEGF